MVRLFKITENILLYTVVVLYIIMSSAFTPDSTSIDVYYVLYRASILLLGLFVVREWLMTKRLEKYDVERFKEVDRKVFLIRWGIVMAFMVVLFFTSRTSGGMVIVFAGLVFNSIMPSPISEGVYLSKKGLVLKGAYYPFEEIQKIVLHDSGDLGIMYGKREIRVAFHNKEEKKEIYKYLNRYITA